jgi:predicted nucleotidyltransferase
MVYHSIELPMERIAEICRRNHIRRLALLGSILTDEFRPDSDVDMLVEFEPGKTPGLEFFGIQREFSGLLGRRVDLNTYEDLSRYFRDEVVSEAKPIYGEG